MKKTTNGITTVKGVKVLGKNCRIKSKPDLAIIFSEKPCNSAGVFTTNKIKGAPIYISSSNIKDGKAQAIIINSGVANVLTGKKGLKDAKEMVKLTAKELRIKTNNVLVFSTGTIGDKLPMDKIRKCIKGSKGELSSSRKAAKEAAKAIMTTDLTVKEFAVKVGKITIAAIAKGSGMIQPNMGTMLCFIMTDAVLSSSKVKKMLKNSVNKSFNMISVDSDTSTSDAVTLMANGMAGKVDEDKFQEALDYVCTEMAKKIIEDGEGATKIIEVNVKGAKTEKEAVIIAKSIINSPLVKSGFPTQIIHGRILAAAGYSGVDFDPAKVNLFYGNVCLVKKGQTTKFDKKKVMKLLKKKKLTVTLDLKIGKKSATALGCDLSYEYVRVNREYYT